MPARTRMNVKSKPFEQIELVSYLDRFQDEVKIYANMHYYRFSEEGFAAKGVKKERIDMGTAPFSVRLMDSNDEIDLKLFNYFHLEDAPNLKNCRAEFSLKGLTEIALECRNHELDLDEAYNYFYQESFKKRSEEPCIEEFALQYIEHKLNHPGFV